MVAVVHAVDVRQRVLAEDQGSRGFSEDQRVTLLGDVNRCGMVSSTATEPGGVQPFALVGDVSLVEINPDGGADFEVAEGHVLEEITDDGNTTVVASVAIRCRCITCPSGTLGPEPTAGIVLCNGNVCSSTAGEFVISKTHEFQEGRGEVRLSAVIRAERADVLKVLT